MADRILRCAVYTRKSSEEGLEQDFNSLHAQREACSAFVLSQRHEGWRLVPTAYDDGGISGGTMERPALKRLLADIEARKVDVIVVYKVDRLTRSLADFAKMVEVFDACGASFVAVTQQFNTTTSMGRLTLNVLLSFAQFEREVTGERIRDKIAASKAKGMWMGGPVPLGYRVENRKLIVVPKEATTVRVIFDRYLTCAGIRELAIQLRAAGMAGLRASSAGGVSRGALYNLLRNPIYVGKIPHKGQMFPGEHEAIVSSDVWDVVQAKLKDGSAPQGQSSRIRKTEPCPLQGKLFDEAGRALSPSHANKRGRRYRYYITHSDDLDADRVEGKDLSGWRLPAQEIERAVIDIVKAMARDRSAIAAQAMEAGWSVHDTERIIDRIGGIDDAGAFACVQRVDLASGLLAVKVVWAKTKTANKPDGVTADETLVVSRSVPVMMKRRGCERRLVIEKEESKARPDRFLLESLSRGMRLWEAMLANSETSAQRFAESEGIDQRMVGRSLPLAFLAPDVIEMIVSGRQPPELTAKKLLSLEGMPLNWAEQRAWLGMT